MRKFISVLIFILIGYYTYAQVLNPGTIGSDQIVCYGSPAQPLTQTPASGGTAPYRYQWQRSNDNGTTWINIYRAANVTYNLPILVKTAMFRRRVTDAANTVLYTNTVTINVTAVLNAGTIGNSQSVCYGTVPGTLVQLTSASGGTGQYTYKWEFSNDGSTWFVIQGVTSSTYTPSVLTADTWFRRWVVDTNCGSVCGNTVKITILPAMVSAQLYDNQTIYNGNSGNINVAISGGTPPYTISFSRNGIAQAPVSNYISGTNISTGILSTGTYSYNLLSVTDANGCFCQNLGVSISITVNETLFTSEVPDRFGYGAPCVLGTEFETSANGYIKKVRLFSHLEESGNHIIQLWVYNGSQYTLFAGPYTWNFSSGIQDWREYTFASPISVQANSKYIISITTGTDPNYYFAQYLNFTSSTSNIFLHYLRGLYTYTLGDAPDKQYSASCYFRDVVFEETLTPGTIGSPQSICYNSVPSQLIGITSPSGGTGTYSYQWQGSTDNINWSNIPGANSSGYSPAALTLSTYFRRSVTSGPYNAVTAPIFINVSPQYTLVQLHSDITIPNNSVTYFNVEISGGIGPYTVNYTRNGQNQNTISNYTSGSRISTGVLTTGTYVYSLTSVSDAIGCSAQTLGTSITITVTEEQGPGGNSNKALIVVNTISSFYPEYVGYIKPYLDNFGIPYDEIDVNSTAINLDLLNEYALIIFGHRHVWSDVNSYPISDIEAAVSGGVGLYSFDPFLFDSPLSHMSSIITELTGPSNTINIPDVSHFITRYHATDIYNPANNVISLKYPRDISQTSILSGGINLASINASGQTISLLEVSSYGNGRVLKWNDYHWMYNDLLGPVYGMDDLVWRGMVWAARKPFALQGMPPMITMRVDDVDGAGTGLDINFQWIQICNEFGIIPWCGTFNNTIPTGSIPLLKALIDNNHATASPHAFGPDSWIYFNHNNIPGFDAAANTAAAGLFFSQNGLTMSKYLVPHYYEISSSALSMIRALGIEFIGIHMLPDLSYISGPEWLMCGPYRINSPGNICTSSDPSYYADDVVLNGVDFFNCVTEIRDDAGYEWYPDRGTTFEKMARGIRQLRRALNSMVLPTLFTHEPPISVNDASTFRSILSTITSSISEYSPEYKSMDYAVQYIRAKNNIRITNVLNTSTSIEISFNGTNDLATKCYLFDEHNGQITYNLVDIPVVNGNVTVSIVK